MTKTTRHSRRGFARSHTHLPRVRLTAEQLEDRSLLSTTGLVDLGSFTADPSGAYDPTRILVRFRPEVARPDPSAILAGSTAGPAIRLVPGLREVTLPVGVSVDLAVATFAASSLVLYAQPDYLGSVSAIPNDPRWPLYGMQRINAPDAWDAHVGGTSVIVADMDTGANYDHEDLCQNIWINQGEIPAERYGNFTDVDFDGLITFWDLNDPVNQGPGLIEDQNGDGRICGSDILQPMDGDAGGWADFVDGDGNGFADDMIGWNFDARNNNPQDLNGHGTHTAGTIGAVGNNGLGVVGVNWVTQLMVLKISSGATSSINLSAAVNALNYAVSMGALVSNNSWGGNGTMPAFRDAIANAQAYGHIVVAAAGNANTNNDTRPFYPANYGTTLDNVISVAATTITDSRASFSNYGVNSVHLGAPGSNINSTLRSGGYSTMSGTSMAAPHVAGAVAYLYSAYPGIDYQTVVHALLAGVDPVPALSGLVSTGGRLNLANSLAILWGGAPGGAPGGGGGFGRFVPSLGGAGEPGLLAVTDQNLALIVQTLVDEAAVETVAVVDAVTPGRQSILPATEEHALGQAQPTAALERIERQENANFLVERDRLFDDLFTKF